ncbi:LexA family transcriptional regulator [Prevotella sp. oral taxon 376]|uniref:S24 family peptidase n=1 Tax=Prevotella sp. oral taxon 376 TaxID=712466 RepID=UPI001E54B23B|nr:LexA family transcriptional regulator [Prevotella sp. oral taxon 376]
MSHKDINDNQMTIAAGLSVGLLGKAKSGGKGLSSSSIEKILLAYDDINPDWLLTGRGPMLKTKGTPNASPTGDESLSSPKDTNKVLNKQEKEARKSPKGIPLIPLEAVAGFPAADSEGVYLEDCERYTIPEFEAKGANFLIRVSGDSMFPLYNNGDIIACRKISDILFFQWGSIYVLDTSQGALVKRVEEAEDDAESILCISENPRFKPFHLPKSDIRSLSTIIGLVRLV